MARAKPAATFSLLVHSFPFRATATMPPRRRIHPRYHGVRGRLDGTYTAVITCANNERVWLGTFAHASSAARAYDAAAWRLGRPRAEMNFRNCRNAEEAADMADAPRLLTEEDHRLHRRRAVLGLVSEQDQRAVQDWYASHPREASEEAEQWTRLAAKSAERRRERHEWREERRAAKAMAEAELARGAANWPVGDPRWIALEDDINSDVTEDDFSDDEEE